MGIIKKKSKPVKKVLAFGTFDILHAGHENFLKQAKKQGDYLIVVVARDKTVAGLKGRIPKNREKARLDSVKQSGLADRAVLGSLGDKYAAIKKYRPDMICLGYDQKYFTENLITKLAEFGLARTRVVRLKPYKARIYKSSKLINL
jgi:FAD synthetase